MRSPLNAVKAKGTLFALVSLAVLAGSIGGGGQVEAASNEFRIISTLAGNDHFVTNWWHGNNGGSNIDTIRADGNPTAGAGV